MRSLLFLLVALTMPCAHGRTLYKCTDDSGVVLYTNQKVANKTCNVLSESAEAKTLKPGDMTNLGLVIEVKPPIAKIQASDRERWYRIDSLMIPAK